MKRLALFSVIFLSLTGCQKNVTCALEGCADSDKVKVFDPNDQNTLIQNNSAVSSADSLANSSDDGKMAELEAKIAAQDKKIDEIKAGQSELPALKEKLNTLTQRLDNFLKDGQTIENWAKDLAINISKLYEKIEGSEETKGIIPILKELEDKVNNNTDLNTKNIEALKIDIETLKTKTIPNMIDIANQSIAVLENEINNVNNRVNELEPKVTESCKKADLDEHSISVPQNLWEIFSYNITLHYVDVICNDKPYMVIVP